MFTKHLVTKDLLEKAKELFGIIFPSETLYDEVDGVLKSCFDEACAHEQTPDNPWNYYLWSYSTPDKPMGEFIGISGIYVEKADPKSAWLGWLGVVPEHRRERFGTRMLNAFADECRDRGFRFARLYTNENNTAAREFYKFNGFKEEKFVGEAPDYVLNGGPVWIYSRSLYPYEECPDWGDRHLDF